MEIFESLNLIDIAVVTVMALFMIFAAKRGLLKSLYKLCSFFACILLANALFPHVSRFLRESHVNDWLKATIIQAMGISDAVSNGSAAVTDNIISNLNLPDFLKLLLMANNNPEAHQVLNVSGLEDYIGGYISNVLINVASMLLAFIIIYIAMKIVGGVIDVISKLPVIHSFNTLGGLIVGALQGTLVIWLVFTALTLFLSRPMYTEFIALVESSRIAVIFFENNIIMRMVTTIKP